MATTHPPVRGYFFRKGEQVDCAACGATFCEKPGKKGAPRKTCSKPCSDYIGKGPGRPLRIKPQPVSGTAAPSLQIDDFLAVFRDAAQVAEHDRSFPSWDTVAVLPDHPAFREWALDPGPDEGSTARAYLPVLGSPRPWNAT